MITWNDILNGEILSSVRSKINTFNNSVADQFTIKDGEISDLQTITTQHGNDISQLRTDVDTNTQDIDNLEQQLQDPTIIFNTLTYDYIKVLSTTINTTKPDWTRIATLNTPDRNSGTYEFAVSIQWVFDTTTTSACIRYSIDNGSTWYESCEEPKDKTDNRHAYYAFPFVHNGGPINVLIEVTRESGSANLVVNFCDVVVKRVQ